MRIELHFVHRWPGNQQKITLHTHPAYEVYTHLRIGHTQTLGSYAFHTQVKKKKISTRIWYESVKYNDGLKSINYLISFNLLYLNYN